ncbi:unnamed protein product, partial [Amaranthus hypochondriacus]
MAFIADKRKSYESYKANENQYSYKKSNGGIKRSNNYFCEHCKIRGHSIQRCFKIHGYPDPKGRKIAANITHEIADNGATVGGTGLTNEQLNNLMLLLNKKDGADPEHKEVNAEDTSTVLTSGNLAGTLCLTTQSMTHTWIIDSGVTDHMCNTINLFTNIRDVDDAMHEVIIPDGSRLKITKVGDIHFNDRIFLKDVLYVPGIRYNLLSVCKLCSDSAISLIFSPVDCWLQDLSKKECLPLGKLKCGLYCTEDKNHFEAFNKVAKVQDYYNPKNSLLSRTTTTMIKEVKLLHLRHGHIPFHRLKLMYPALNISCVEESLICTICPLARQSRLSFSHSEIRTQHPFELLHIDLWGPYGKLTH